MVVLFWASKRRFKNTQHLSSNNCLSRSPHLSSNINHILTPSNHSKPFIRNIVIYCAVNGYRIPVKTITIKPPDQFGEMYTIVVTSIGYKTVQLESIDVDTSMSRLEKKTQCLDDLSHGWWNHPWKDWILQSRTRWSRGWETQNILDLDHKIQDC